MLTSLAAEIPTMQQLDEAAYSQFATLLGDRVAAYAPEWTDNNESDPGIQLIELFAFLTESLLYRASAIPERGRYSADRLAKFALALANRNEGIANCMLERPRYFSGQVLGVEDFGLEQDYFRRRLRRLNRELHGSGVVRGLEVSVQSDSSGAEDQVVVTPGFALNQNGEEIEVCDSQTLGLPKDGRLLYVVLLHVQRPSHLEPAANGQDAQFARVEERFAIRLEATALDDGVTLARLLREEGSWRIDNDFKPRRVT
jgi:hypothetical protein